MLAATGCVGNETTAAGTIAPDRSIVTGAIPSSENAGAEQGGDVAAVMRAVATAKPADASAAGVPWADPTTGTVGVISSIAKSDADGQACRRFSTTRHDYAGVALYVGEACRSPYGDWRMVEFRARKAGDGPVAAIVAFHKVG